MLLQPSAQLRVGVSAAVVVAGLAAALAVAEGAKPAGSPPALPPHSVSSIQAAIDGTLPVVAEYRYRLTGKVRLLLFWISRDGVGGARIRVRRGERDGSGLDLLIGSTRSARRAASTAGATSPRKPAARPPLSSAS